MFLKYRIESTIILTFIAFSSFSQSNVNNEKASIPQGWHLMDPAKDHQWGINLSNAYNFLSSKKIKSKRVIVAVIDSGIDTLHEDLKPILWVNSKEIPNNSIDDDKNGYIDDIHGWNFLGNKDGKNVEQDSYEGARIYHDFKSKFEASDFDSTKLDKAGKYQYAVWIKAKKAVMGEGNEEGPDLLFMQRVLKVTKKNDSLLKVALGKDVYSAKDLELYEPVKSTERIARSAMLSLFKGNDMQDSNNKEFIEGFNDYLNSEIKKVESREKAPQNYRGDIVKDNENDLTDRFYGNNNIMVSLDAAEHGTHVSGIIAAARNNKLGIDGIADNVRIMSLRTVPDGDEHDKDIALAIRYAADNGARIINMSFGKSFSPNKKWIDEAVDYAKSKNVLLVHAAGNDHKNVDTAENYPCPLNIDGVKRASNWITVGASANGDTTNAGFTASFSNYGKNEVDVFAPGVKIYSTYPGGNVYRSMDGTSMAAPVVSGIAALILSYFPNLTAEQLKLCIEKSVTPVTHKVKKPGTNEMVDLSSLCKTGGIVDAFSAVKYAARMQASNQKK